MRGQAGGRPDLRPTPPHRRGESGRGSSSLATSKARVGLVVGCGSPWRGDDGVGLVAVEPVRACWEEEVRGRRGGLGGDLRRGGRSSRIVGQVEFMEAPLYSLELLNLLSGRPFCLLLDAFDAGFRPGTVRAWAWRGGTELAPVGSEGQAGEGDGGVAQLDIGRAAGSLHGWDVARTLALGETLGRRLPVSVWMVGVQVDREHLWGEGLSPAVAQALPRLVEKAVARLADCVQGGRRWATGGLRQGMKGGGNVNA